MNYTLNQLRIYATVVRLGSITKAARELNLTQPAVSIQLKNFSGQFDIPLIEIINKKIRVTDFGKSIARSAENMLEEVHRIDQTTQSYKGLLSGKLKIGLVSTAKYIAPYFISDFMQGHPGIELKMDVSNKAQVFSDLAENAIDFAFVTILPKDIPIQKMELLEQKLYLVGSQTLPVNKRQSSYDFFNSIPLIYREPGSGTRQIMEQFIRKNKIPVTMKMTLTSNEQVKQAVMSGLGYSIMPLIGLKNELMAKQLHILPVKGFPIRSTWYLIWLKNKPLSPLSQAFLNYLRDEKQVIVESKFKWYEEFT